MMDRRRFVVEMVVAAYKKAIDRPFIKVTVPQDSRQEESVIQFWQVAGTKGRDINVSVRQVVDLYSKEWCARIFSRPYPPLSIVVGPKALRHLARENRVTQAQTASQVFDAADEIAKMLISTVGLEGGLEAVRGGWPEDKLIREQVLSNLTCRKNGEQEGYNP